MWETHSCEAVCGSQSKVSNLHMTVLVQKDVPGLQISMNHALNTEWNVPQLTNHKEYV